MKTRPAARLIMQFIFISSLLIPAVKANATPEYTIAYVYDGDTVKLTDNQSDFKLRLADIDAPERNQEYGQKSRRALSKLCKGNHIKINVELAGKDKYGRNLGRLKCNQIDASLYLAQNGYAWHNAKYSSDPVIKNATAKAREKRIGLWSSEKPTPPWVWRHLNLQN